MLGVSEIDQRDTHRLIPAQFADEGVSVLTRLTEDEETLNAIFELDNATNDRLLGESGRLPGIDVRELVFGIPSYRIINAAFCHPSPGGARFNGADRGAWYGGFELETAQAEVAYHRQHWLQETGWEEEDVADYLDYLADFHAPFHDLRDPERFSSYLDPEDYKAAQALAQQLLREGSAGIVYRSVRWRTGTCLACFRPVLVTNVRPGDTYTFVFPDRIMPPRIRKK